MNQPQKTITLRLIIQLLFVVVVMPLLPLLISRHWDWWEAWAYALIYALGFVLSRLLVARRHPDLIAERARSMDCEDAKPWDRRLAPLLAWSGVATPVVAGLDKLFSWSPAFSLLVVVASLVVVVAGYLWGSYALVENRYFSGVVRIQSDRGHRVVSSGPYRWMRHPGYAGALWTYLATPLLLGSMWALLPTFFTMAVLVIRTRLEDRTLKEELDGYRDYAARVRYRLLPGLW